MIKIDKALLDKVSEEARKSERKRKNFNFHEKMEDTLHRMLNAIEPDSYIQPHKHEDPDKSEAFIVLRGKFLLCIFDNEGNVIDHTILNPDVTCYGVDIKPRVWHTIISLESGSVIYEVKDGPYLQASDKNFASWAPKEGSEGCIEYMNDLIKRYV